MIDVLSRLADRHTLTEDEAAGAMRAIMLGKASPAQITGFAMALSARGESTDEITGMASAAQEFAAAVPFDSNVLDTCGTGGDGLDTFNISTASAIVVAACGVRVAKHGNRSVSSACGSADVLEELGVRVDTGPEIAGLCLSRAGITFMLAPLYHPAFEHAAGPRRELGTRTVFNLLGALCNPARARLRTLGVPRQSLVGTMAEVLQRLGVTHAMVFHSDDGMDELSTAAPAKVVQVDRRQRRTYWLDPTDLGLPRSAPGDLTGGDRQVNASIIRQVLAGARGPARDVVILNASAALQVAGLAMSWHEGLRLARAGIDSGRAAATLARWSEVSWAEPVRASA
jgi:anthranilate phosphoribosyltransferase